MPTLNYTLEIDALALGMTRPAMFAGVNFNLFLINLSIGVLSCIYTKSFWGTGLFVINHVILLRCSARDANFLSLWTTAFARTFMVKNFWFWGGVNSYEPG